MCWILNWKNCCNKGNIYNQRVSETEEDEQRNWWRKGSKTKINSHSVSKALTSSAFFWHLDYWFLQVGSPCNQLCWRHRGNLFVNLFGCDTSTNNLSWGSINSSLGERTSFTIPGDLNYFHHQFDALWIFFTSFFLHFYFSSSQASLQPKSEALNFLCNEKLIFSLFLSVIFLKAFGLSPCKLSRVNVNSLIHSSVFHLNERLDITQTTARSVTKWMKDFYQHLTLKKNWNRKTSTGNARTIK